MNTENERRSTSALLTAFGNRVRAMREQKVWSQETLAHKAGLHRTYVGGIERGERNPTLKSINKIAKALGVPTRDLFPQDS